MSKYEGKVVWIVGASSGIGKALARSFSEVGSRLILSGRSEEKLTEVAETLRRSGGSAEVLSFDISELDKLQDITEKACKVFGRVEVVLLASGVGNRSSVLESDFSLVEYMTKVNFLGPVGVAKALLSSLSNRGNLTEIVVLSSIQAKIVLPNRAPYTASKHALHSYFTSLRYELKGMRDHDPNYCNIRICIVTLGYVNTDHSRNALTTNATTPHNNQDESTEKGYPVEYTAQYILTQLLKDKEEFSLMQPTARMAQFLAYYLPFMYDFIMVRRASK